METADNVSNKIILVPVDYSEYSVLACRFAAKIANKSGNDICLLHSFYSPAFDLIELTGGIQTQQQLRTDVTEKLLESESSDMKEFSDKLRLFPEFETLQENRIKHEIKAGLAKDEIISLADEIKPEMVVMGTRGADKKTSSILGSITEVCIRKLKIPVLAIPEDYEFIGESRLKKIVYLTDFDESDFVSIKKLLRFTNYFNMEIHCVHIGTRTDKWEIVKMQGLKDYFQKSYQLEAVECHILENKPDLLQTLDKYIQDNNINIISLTHRKRSLMEKVFRSSTAKKVFYHTHIPLLVFHS
ncbi:MAG: universal stress protein [Bacteroidales bacterium]|nr:universal stress protein [Bacteroidales bacterium]MBN2819425.1 universal stress protein [Bacteroidales bacterium]